MPFRKILILVAIVAFSASMFLPATASYSGFDALIAGIFAWLVDPLWGLAWTANILFMAGIMLGLLSKKPIAPRIVGGLAVLFCLVSFLPEDIMVNEGGGTEPNVLGMGFYLWLVANALLPLATFVPAPISQNQS